MNKDEHLEGGVVRIEEVLRLLSISRSSLYRLVRDQRLARPLHLGGRRISVWRLKDVHELIERSPRE